VPKDLREIRDQQALLDQLDQQARKEFKDLPEEMCRYLLAQVRRVEQNMKVMFGYQERNEH
jgi:hypothetical protein